MKPLYKSADAKAAIMELYDEKLKSLQIDYEEIDVPTSFGRTRVIKTGNENGRPVVLFHGINAGAPLTIEAVKGLCNDFLMFFIDTIGQATKSEERRINIRDQSYAVWADEVLGHLNLQHATCIGISYGAYILQKLIAHRPKKVDKCIFVVPSGLVNGSFVATMKKLSFPLFRYAITKSDAHLKSFIQSFVPEHDDFMFRLQKALLTGLNMDYRRPTLLRASDVQHYTNPVFLMVADDDVFFPGIDALTRAKELFPNIKGTHILSNCKHMPGKDRYPEIQQVIKTWMEQ